MKISDALESNNEIEILKATEKKLAAMLDALPPSKTRDASTLAAQIRGIRERLADIDRITDDASAQNASFLLEMKARKRRG